jgi:acetoin utilization deacetylase AcuC-like enzyme
MIVRLWTDAAMDAHAWPGHSERPARREAAAHGVRDAAGPLLIEEVPVPATDEEIARVHDGRYVALLAAAEERGGGWLDPDTYHVWGQG